MTAPSMACWWQADTRTLDLRTRACAWRVRLWPDPAVLIAIGPATAAAPPLHLMLADAPVASAELVDLVVAARTVPAPVRRCVASCIPAQEQLPGLQLLHTVPQALPLLLAVPALGRALLATWTLSADKEGLTKLLQAHQGRAQTRALLRWLGLPDKGAMLKAVQKVADPIRWTLHDLRHLAQWLSTEPKTVQHLPSLSTTQLRVWQSARRSGVAGVLGSGVYRGLHMAPLPEGLDALPDALAHLADAGARDRRLLRPVDSPLELAQRLFLALAETRTQAAPRATVPPGRPIPSPMHTPAWISPLATPDALRAEGEQMRHCAGLDEYRTALLAGRGYGYAVHHPAGRATAWISATAQAGLVRLVDLQAAEDVEPDPEVRSAVAAWVDAHNAWARHTLHGGALPAGPPAEVPDAAGNFRLVERVDLHALTHALLLLGAPMAPARDAQPCPAQPDTPDPTWAEDLEAALQRSLWDLIQDTTRLRDELMDLVQDWTGVSAPDAAQQDAIALDFARSCQLLVRALARERSALVDALEPDDDPVPTAG